MPPFSAMLGQANLPPLNAAHGDSEQRHRHYDNRHYSNPQRPYSTAAATSTTSARPRSKYFDEDGEGEAHGRTCLPDPFQQHYSRHKRDQSHHHRSRTAAGSNPLLQEKKHHGNHVEPTEKRQQEAPQPQKKKQRDLVRGSFSLRGTPLATKNNHKSKSNAATLKANRAIGRVSSLSSTNIRTVLT